ncbi:unnamed protein product [Ectocarpus sp. CCAP 1310/34]|nr:unnamed protein product [Ectocarpus sp. CCAP 1310/34]
MSSAGDVEPTAGSEEQTRTAVQGGRDAELASLKLQVSRLAALVEESMNKKEPGSVVADAASRGGGIAGLEAKINPRSRSAEAVDFSSSEREMVDKDHISCWKAAGPADREQILWDQPEWARVRYPPRRASGGRTMLSSRATVAAEEERRAAATAAAARVAAAAAAAATRRGEGVARGLVAVAKAATTVRVADCTESKPVRCEQFKGCGHDKSKYLAEEAVLVAEVPARGALADATALDVAEAALVVGDISGECTRWSRGCRAGQVGPRPGDEEGGEWPVREAIGSMMWVSTLSRPEHDVGVDFLASRGLAVYVDANYADTEDKRSVSGLATTVGGTVVSHGSKTQSIVPSSSTEADYIAAGEGVKEALFVRAVLSFAAPETSGSSI